MSSVVASLLALLVVSRLPLGLRIQGVVPLVIGAVVLLLANALLRPLLIFLTLPLTLLTFGASVFLVNGFIVLLVSWLVPGFEVAGFLSAIAVAVVVGLLTFVFHLVLQALFHLL
jgi:putative membrane protein